MIRPRGKYSGSSLLLVLLPFAFLKPPAPLKHMPTDHIPCFCSLYSHLKSSSFLIHRYWHYLRFSFLPVFLPWFLMILISRQKKKASNTLTSQFLDLLFPTILSSITSQTPIPIVTFYNQLQPSKSQVLPI